MKSRYLSLMLATGWLLSGCSKKETVVKQQEVPKPQNVSVPALPRSPSDKNDFPIAPAAPPSADEVGRTIHAERAY